MTGQVTTAPELAQALAEVLERHGASAIIVWRPGKQGAPHAPARLILVRENGRPVLPVEGATIADALLKLARM